MDRRRVAGVGVLAAAVIAVSVGAGLGRPQVVGTASAPPVAPPPQVGDCLYAGPKGPWDRVRADGTLEDVAYTRRYAPCRDPWYGEVVGVREQAAVQNELALADDGGRRDPCAASAAVFLGRPEVPAVDGWFPITAGAGGLQPDRRQLASGQHWLACVFGPPAWGPGGEPVEYVPSIGARTTESLRGRWDDIDVRNRFGFCGSGPPVNRSGVFCGEAHDRELLAWGSWFEPTDAAALQQGCSRQAALVMQRKDPTVDGAVVVEVLVDDNLTAIPSVLTGQTTLEPQGSATCTVRAADPGRRLDATVVGLGGRPAPLTTG